MIHRKLAFLVTTGLLAVATACGQSPYAVEKKTESTTQTSAGTVTTSSETKHVGTTLEAKSETKADTPAGTVESKAEMIEGTVTVFTTGKKIEVMTGEKKMHSFSLDGQDVVYSVDGTVEVGIRVVDEAHLDPVESLGSWNGSRA
jgi:hypothetical protein